MSDKKELALAKALRAADPETQEKFWEIIIQIWVAKEEYRLNPTIH